MWNCQACRCVRLRVAQEDGPSSGAGSLVRVCWARAQGAGERVKRLRMQHRASVPAFSIRPAAEATNPGNPSPTGHAAAAGAGGPVRTPRPALPASAGTGLGGGAGVAGAGARGAAMRMSLPAKPASRGGGARTPLTFRCGTPLCSERRGAS